ncbi:hypothetical protein [Rhodococcus tukisamuensis]|uniref:Uncharacterized protein n=1 Tax=Rhodococcus tukisamuensis TaxID=168276 RepID=A0A1G6UWA3_9NOCA|nr:hypothetical protein [Rhodococcus tukisamuensis]SDD45629.1 hypothetical protein SAMN05444580_104318 [Rhodococcus tukisamuensis]
METGYIPVLVLLGILVLVAAGRLVWHYRTRRLADHEYPEWSRLDTFTYLGP